MANNFEPKTMRAWLYSTASGGLEKSLKLSEATIKPLAKDQVLVKTHSTSLNPVDYKLPELGMLARFAISVPAAPCMDFSGTIVEVGEAVKAADAFRVGEKVFGRAGPQQYGTLAEYVITKPEFIASLPKGVNEGDASTIGTAGQTAYQSIQPYVKSGDKVFINGGSGGTGTFGIQIAKALGCHVTTSCSSKNVDLVKSLGADEVIDYSKQDVSGTLKAKGQIFKLVVDNVGASPADLHKAADQFLIPGSKFVQVGGGFSLGDMKTTATRALLPSFLGGGKSSYQFLVVQHKQADIDHIAKFMQEGKVKPVVDETFGFLDAPKAFEKLKSGRARGKIVVQVEK